MNNDHKTVREALERRYKDIKDWIDENAPYITSDQKHLDTGTKEQAYWHYGYVIALSDSIAALDRIENKQARKHTLDELLEGITEENRHELIDRIEAVETVTVDEINRKCRSARDQYAKKNGSSMGFNHWIYLSNEYPNGLRIVKDK